MKTSIMILLVMSRHHRSSLLEHLEGCSSEVLAVCDFRGARRVLQTRLPLEVVIADAQLSDGTWSDVLDCLTGEERCAELIVCTPVIDIRLWKEVSSRGAYDLLTEPYQQEEIRRVIKAAASRSRMRSFYPASSCRSLSL